MTNSDKINQIINDYTKVINKFKQNAKIQNGTDLAWRGNSGILDYLNKPVDFGSATTTTGWCVSVSEALTNSSGFNMLNEIYGAYSKLISIDIKEQYYGYCYNGSQNKWHTAVLVQIEDFKFVIDLTCGQFGNEFVNKNIWYVEAWLTKFRSGLCTHKVTDFYDNIIDVKPINKARRSKDELLRAKYNLQNFTTIDDSERRILIDFTKNFEEFNTKLILGTFTKNELDVFANVIDLYKTKTVGSYTVNGYSVLNFNNKTAATNWLTLNVGNDYSPDMHQNFELKQNLLMFNTIEEANDYYQFTEHHSDNYKLIIKMVGVYASKHITMRESYVIFAGSKMSIDTKNYIVAKSDKSATILMLGNASTEMVELNESTKTKHSDKYILSLGMIVGSDWSEEPALKKYLSNGNKTINLIKLKKLSEKDLIKLANELVNTSDEDFNKLNESEDVDFIFEDYYEFSDEELFESDDKKAHKRLAKKKRKPLHKRLAKKIGKHVTAKKIGNYLNYIASD